MPTQLTQLPSVRPFVEASYGNPQLLIFLRHGGCPFFRQTLSRVQTVAEELVRLNVEPVLVHMLDESTGRKRFAQAGLADISAIADPQQDVYRAVGLPRATLWQVAGPGVWKAAVCAIGAGHRPGRPVGDVRQMPGVIGLVNGEVVATEVAQQTGDLPDLLEFAHELLECRDSRR